MKHVYILSLSLLVSVFTGGIAMEQSAGQEGEREAELWEERFPYDVRSYDNTLIFSTREDEDGPSLKDRVEIARIAIPHHIGAEASIYENDLGKIPEKEAMIQELLSKLLKVTRLTAQFRELTVLPLAIGNYTQLKQLWVHGGITELPKEIGNLSHLEWLNLSGNNLSELPASMGRLSNLKNLNLSGNKLSDLPQEMEQLKKLRVLKISKNAFGAIPECVYALCA